MIEDESDVFEITDFTTASEWERFIAKLEEIIHDWKLTYSPKAKKLNKGELTTKKWRETVESVQFADFKFVVTRYCLSETLDELETSCESLRDAGAIKESGDTVTNEEEQGSGESGLNEVEEDGDKEVIPLLWQDLMSSENDFPGRCHCLCRWYGLRDFVVLAPGSNMEDILSESRANLLMSSIAIALHNTSSQIPMFIQVHQRWRRLFLGQCIAVGFRTVFEMVHLKHIPHQYNHMAGLLDVFRAKTNSPVTEHSPVSVAVRFTYVLQDWATYSWPQQPPDLDSCTAGEIGVTEFGELPFGSCEDPVSELHLSATWPSLSEEMIVDNDVYSDLDPLQAPHWCVRVRMADNPQCLLGDYLQEFVLLCQRKESTGQLLGRPIEPADDTDVSQALNRLTEPVPYNLSTLGTVVTRATSKLQMKPEEAPIPVNTLNEILLFIFPDAKDETKGSSSASDSVVTEAETLPVANHQPSEQNDSQSDNQKYTELHKQFKSAPTDSLCYRLAVCMCIVNHSYGGLRAVAHLWQEFVLEMRYRWENMILIPDQQLGPINMGFCLLHQKLQMLNCCIERKQSREAHLNKPASKTKQSNSISSDSTEGGEYPVHKLQSKIDSSFSSEEEFYECLENADEGTSNESGQTVAAIATDQVEAMETDQSDNSSTHKPEGRLRPCGDMKLVNVNALLYVPVTQEPAPMTEDMLEEHAEVLAKLGTSAEGANLRARMQSACLLSDMESFKAANPGCTLSDFVRWYSPRDWITEEVMEEDGTVTVKGQLSQRMQIPGNVWCEVWQSARPVPAHRQRRLFDDTKEAEKVLHWLSSMKPADVALQLMPILVHAAVTKLIEQEESQLPMLKKLMNHISNKAARAMRAQKLEVKQFEDLVKQIARAEVILTRAHSLLNKFSQEKHDLCLSNQELQQFVSNLLELPDVQIVGAAKGPLGVIIHRLFAASQKNAYLLPGEGNAEEDDKPATNIPDFPDPVGKEYILRTMCQRPAPWSRTSPQRMYCVLMKDDFRLAAAFTTDTTFL